MFDAFTGKLVYKQKNRIYLENDNGLKEIYVDDENKYINEQKYHLYIYCSKLVSHKSIEKTTNFGFETINEMCLFERLINIEGIGPKTALKFIESGIDNFYRLVENRDVNELVDRYKISMKIAESIVMSHIKLRNPSISASQMSKINAAIENLQNIGYSKDLSSRVVWKRQEEVINNNFAQIFCLLIEDIKNERASQ